MVEELIAEGHTLDDVERILVEVFGMSKGDAQLMVDTALGGDGDTEVTLLEPDGSELVAAGRFDETKIKRYGKGTKTSGKVKGGRFAPKAATEQQGPSSDEERAKQTAAQTDGEAGKEAAAPTAPPAHNVEKGEVAQRLLGDFKDTQALYTDGKGRYTPERLALHDEIIDRFLEASGEKPQEKPTSLFMAGGTAAGKTTILDQFDDEVPNAVIINPDDIKAMLPEYSAMLEGGDEYAATGTHEESSDIAKKLLETTNAKKYNAIIDGTGDSEPGKFESKVKAAQMEGRNAKVVLVDIPTDLAVERSMERAKKTGRMVPEKTIREIHATVARRHADWVEDVDNWEVWANETEPPTKIAERSSGVIKIHDRARYQQLLDKGKDVPGEDQA